MFIIIMNIVQNSYIRRSRDQCLWQESGVSRCMWSVCWSARSGTSHHFKAHRVHIFESTREIKRCDGVSLVSKWTTRVSASWPTGVAMTAPPTDVLKEVGGAQVHGGNTCAASLATIERTLNIIRKSDTARSEITASDARPASASQRRKRCW